MREAQTNSRKQSSLMIRVLLLPLLISVFAQAHEKQWPEKRLRQAWPNAQTFSSKQVTLDAGKISQLEGAGVKIRSEDRSPIFYFAKDQAAKPLGVIVFIDEFGANGKMEVSVAINGDGRIQKIDLWDQSENPAVAKDDFLKQFVGKTAKDSFAPNKDFKPAPDAIKASQAVASAANKALKITNLVFERK